MIWQRSGTRSLGSSPDASFKKKSTLQMQILSHKVTVQVQLLQMLRGARDFCTYTDIRLGMCVALFSQIGPRPW